MKYSVLLKDHQCDKLNLLERKNCCALNYKKSILEPSGRFIQHARSFRLNLSFDLVTILNNTTSNKTIYLSMRFAADVVRHLFAGALIPGSEKVNWHLNKRTRKRRRSDTLLLLQNAGCCAPVVSRSRNRIYTTHYST